MSIAHKHNGREIRPTPAVDFDYAAVDKESDCLPDSELRQSGVEFELAQRVALAIRDANNPAIAADQVCWLFGWTKEGTRELAGRHEISQPGFLKGAQRIAREIGLRLSPRQLQTAAELTH